MRAVIQRCDKASVIVNEETVGSIEKGLTVFLGISKSDTTAMADKIAQKIAELRIFEDECGKMNLSLLDVGGEALVISNFTLYGDASHGRRPSFIEAQRPNEAKIMYEYFIKKLHFNGVKNVQTGVFGADMKVNVSNDGPVTIIIDSDDININS